MEISKDLKAFPQDLCETVPRFGKRRGGERLLRGLWLLGFFTIATLWLYADVKNVAVVLWGERHQGRVVGKFEKPGSKAGGYFIKYVYEVGTSRQFGVQKISNENYAHIPETANSGLQRVDVYTLGAGEGRVERALLPGESVWHPDMWWVVHLVLLVGIASIFFFRRQGAVLSGEEVADGGV